MEIIGVVGAGTMGAGIAQIGLEHGHEVVLHDVDEEAIERGRLRVREGLARRAAKLDLDADSIDDWVDGRLAGLRQAEALVSLAAQTDVVIEAALEHLPLKQDIFRALDEEADPGVILATNTSALRVADVAALATRRERILGLHFFNPAPVMPLVEVVVTPETDPAVVERAERLLQSWDKTTVRSADLPGFIVNRVNRPFTLEALRDARGRDGDGRGDRRGHEGRGLPDGPVRADGPRRDRCQSRRGAWRLGGSRPARPAPAVAHPGAPRRRRAGSAGSRVPASTGTTRVGSGSSIPSSRSAPRPSHRERSWSGSWTQSGSRPIARSTTASHPRPTSTLPSVSVRGIPSARLSGADDHWPVTLRRSDSYAPSVSRFRTSAVCIAIVSIVAISGCVARPTASGGASIRPSALPTAQAASPSPSAMPSPTPGWTAWPSFAPSDPELYARLPAEVRGLKLIRYVASGNQFPRGGDVCSFVCPDEVPSFAEALDISVDDLAVGFAFQEEAMNRPLPPGALLAWVVAFRATGVAESRLVEARVTNIRELNVPPQTLASGDKTVTRLWYGWVAEYLYAREDTLYVIYGEDRLSPRDLDSWRSNSPIPADVAAMIAALP